MCKIFISDEDDAWDEDDFTDGMYVQKLFKNGTSSNFKPEYTQHINSTLEMMSVPPTNAGKHVVSNIVCGKCHQYTNHQSSDWAR